MRRSGVQVTSRLPARHVPYCRQSGPRRHRARVVRLPNGLADRALEPCEATLGKHSGATITQGERIWVRNVVLVVAVAIAEEPVDGPDIHISARVDEVPAREDRDAGHQVRLPHQLKSELGHRNNGRVLTLMICSEPR